jgi:hypothetical protein
MRLWSVEGNRQRLDGGAMYGNVPRALWAHWTPPDEDNRIELACRGLLVEDLDGLTVLFETGIGAFFEPKLRARYGVLEPEHMLLWSLGERALTHEDSRAPIISSATVPSSAPSIRMRAIALRSSRGSSSCSGQASASSSSTASMPRAFEEKREFLDDKIARGVRLFFTHDLGCALARAARDERGRLHTIDELETVAGLAL